MRRDILQRMGGWDQYCLTEDADIGIRLSAMGLPIRVLYDDQFVTQEETPPTVGQFIRQRTRWNQGFLQVLFKGQWLRLHDYRQRLLALYTLSFPALQSVMMIYVPVSIWMMLFVKVPVLLAIISSLPLYMLAIQLAISIVGLYEFTDVHHLQPSPLSPFALLTAYIPYQMMLNYAALRAAWRQIRGNNTWEKTAHIGAHRSAVTGIEPGRLVEAEEAAGD
jgi:cellulose synthase/poly-beta-1,6-N-acetylglucosamine synthase-like glycosyltransferase